MGDLIQRIVGKCFAEREVLCYFLIMKRKLSVAAELFNPKQTP